MKVLELNNKNIPLVLEAFGKLVNDDGYIVDRKTKKIVRCKFTNRKLTADNIGGVLPGSEIFIEDSDIAYARYIIETLDT